MEQTVSLLEVPNTRKTVEVAKNFRMKDLINSQKYYSLSGYLSEENFPQVTLPADLFANFRICQISTERQKFSLAEAMAAKKIFMERERQIDLSHFSIRVVDSFIKIKEGQVENSPELDKFMGRGIIVPEISKNGRNMPVPCSNIGNYSIPVQEMQDFFCAGIFIVIISLPG